MKKKINCLMGPTASGKSSLAMQLAKKVPVEIVSVDSAQVFRGMDIGTAKPTLNEKLQVPHHMIDLCDPAESFSVGKFVSEVIRCITTIEKRGGVPVLVGGTMLYFKALQRGISELPIANQEVRRSLDDEAKQLGWPAMHQRLARLDAIVARRIHPHDAQRIQRALEVIEITGQKLSSLQQTVCSSPLEFRNFVVMPSSREVLHQRIADRLGHMFDHGFVEEVYSLYMRGDLTAEHSSIRCVGYRQIWDYCQGLNSLERAKEKALFATRQFAKRQITWLNQWPDAERLPDDTDSAVALLVQAVSPTTALN